MHNLFAFISAQFVISINLRSYHRKIKFEINECAKGTLKILFFFSFSFSNFVFERNNFRQQDTTLVAVENLSEEFRINFGNLFKSPYWAIYIH